MCLESRGYSQTTQSLEVPSGSPRWNLEGEAKVAEYQGRKNLRLDGGAAVLKDFEMRDGVIDVDMDIMAKQPRTHGDVLTISPPNRLDFQH